MLFGTPPSGPTSTSTQSQLHVRSQLQGVSCSLWTRELGCCRARGHPPPQPPPPQGKRGIRFACHGDQELLTLLLGGWGGLCRCSSRASWSFSNLFPPRTSEPWSQVQTGVGRPPQPWAWGLPTVSLGPGSWWDRLSQGQDHQDNGRWTPGHRGRWWSSGNRAWNHRSGGQTAVSGTRPLQASCPPQRGDRMTRHHRRGGRLLPEAPATRWLTNHGFQIMQPLTSSISKHRYFNYQNSSE